MLRTLPFALAVAALSAGCGEEKAPRGVGPPRFTPAEHGLRQFGQKYGGLSCADCHSTTAEDQPRPDRRRLGHTLADSTRRPSWWYGSLEASKGAKVDDAVLTCVARFQQRTWNTTLPTLPDGRKDLSKVEHPREELAAIVSYLDTIARPGPHPASPAKRDASRAAIARVEALTGDAVRGREVWAKACALCHGNGGRNEIGPSLRGATSPDRLRVIDYVRAGPTKSERDTADAWMPLFTPDVLPDQDLADVAELIDGQKWE